MIPLLQFQERSLNGPVMTTDDFDLAFSMKIRELVEKHDITYNPDELVVDDKTADAVFNAGVELLADIGLYHLGTQRVIQFTKEEILEFVNERKAEPGKIIMGSGNDVITIEHRGSNDTRPMALYAGAAGAIEEDEFIPFIQSFAQEEKIAGMGIAGGIVKVGNIEPKAGTLSEIQCALWEQEQLKEVLHRVGRPGLSLGLLCTASSVGATMQCIDETFRNKTNTHIGVHIIPEQKIDWDRLLLSHFCHDRGIVPWQSAMSLIGGLCRNAADAAVGLVANALGHMSYAHGPICSLFPTNMNGTWADRPTNWAVSAASRASERNIKLAIGSAIAGTAEWARTPVQFYQEACQSLVYTASGLSYAWIAGGSGFDACALYDIMTATAGMKREKAITIANAIMDKINELMAELQPPEEQIPFLETYDKKTIKPKQKHMDMLNRAREELARFGVPL